MGCYDDPTYSDNGWTCSNWAAATTNSGYSCHTGVAPVNTPARISALLAACPVSCADVTPDCHPPSFPPPFPSPPSPPLSPAPPSAPPLKECSLDGPPYHVLWSVEWECNDQRDTQNGIKGGRPYINNLGGTGTRPPSERHDCGDTSIAPPTNIQCTDKVMYFRKVVPEWPAGSGQRVDLKISAIDTSRIPDYADDITYDIYNTDTMVGGPSSESTYGIQGCFYQRHESLQMVLHGKTGAFEFQFVRPDQSPIVLDAFFLTAFDLDRGTGSSPGFDAFGIIYRDANGLESGYRRVGVYPDTIDNATCPGTGNDNGENGCTQLTCCHGKGYGAGDDCDLEANYAYVGGGNTGTAFSEDPGTNKYTRNACTDPWPYERDMHFRARDSVYTNVVEPNDGPFNLEPTSKLHAVTTEMQNSPRVMVLMSGRPANTGHRLSLTGGLSNVIGLCPPTAPPSAAPPPPTG